MIKNIVIKPTLLLSLTFLSACSGGGGASAVPQAPNATTNVIQTQSIVAVPQTAAAESTSTFLSSNDIAILDLSNTTDGASASARVSNVAPQSSLKAQINALMTALMQATKHHDAPEINSLMEKMEKSMTFHRLSRLQQSVLVVKYALIELELRLKGSSDFTKIYQQFAAIMRAFSGGK